jgi:Aldo/keto reductase family
MGLRGASTRDLFARLDNRYGLLRTVLDQYMLPDFGIDPSHVIVAVYPPALENETGVFCPQGNAGLTIGTLPSFLEAHCGGSAAFGGVLAQYPKSDQVERDVEHARVKLNESLAAFAFKTQALRGRSGSCPYIATKAGKRLPTQVTSGYTVENLREWVKRSRDYLEVDTLDLVQLHCPPTDLYDQPSVFDALDRLQNEKLIRNYGVSGEKIEEAIKVIECSDVVSVRIIFNILRRPVDLFLELAKKKNVAILARVPLASGLLSGKFTRVSTFDKADHRNFNRNGEFFDVGETFSGMPYEKGLEAVEKIRPLVSSGNMAQLSIANEVVRFW